MATASFHLRKGRRRKDDAARELARTVPEWCAAPYSTLKHLVAKERLAMVGVRRPGAIPHQGAGRGVRCCRFHGHLE